MRSNRVTLVAAASFEVRSVVATKELLADKTVGRNDVHLADVIGDSAQREENVKAFKALGVEAIERLDRRDSRSLWNWAWRTIGSAPVGDIVVDVTCFPRELLGMILFAVSVMREKFRKITINYVSAPEGGYATQNPELEESARWLSRGVYDIRSIVGFPGEFSGERAGHLIVLAGHEVERMMEIVEYVEPRRLSIGGGKSGSSTTAGAGEFTRSVVKALRRTVPVPKTREVSFPSDSVRGVYRSLQRVQCDFRRENVSLSAMNTKIAFVGAALFALRERRVRMVYAVPAEYNPLYCQGVGEAMRFDVTELIQQAETETVDAV